MFLRFISSEYNYPYLLLTCFVLGLSTSETIKLSHNIANSFHQYHLLSFAITLFFILLTSLYLYKWNLDWNVLLNNKINNKPTKKLISSNSFNILLISLSLSIYLSFSYLFNLLIFSFSDYTLNNSINIPFLNYYSLSILVHFILFIILFIFSIFKRLSNIPLILSYIIFIITYMRFWTVNTNFHILAHQNSIESLNISFLIQPICTFTAFFTFNLIYAIYRYFINFDSISDWYCIKLQRVYLNHFFKGLVLLPAIFMYYFGLMGTKGL